MFIASVGLLAVGRESQVQYLERIRTAPSTDELALDFDESFRMLPMFENAGLLDERILGPLTRIDEILTAMTRDQVGWEIDALDSDQWCQVRAEALEVLMRLGGATSNS
jgi:hypothetical protein